MANTIDTMPILAGEDFHNTNLLNDNTTPSSNLIPEDAAAGFGQTRLLHQQSWCERTVEYWWVGRVIFQPSCQLLLVYPEWFTYLTSSWTWIYCQYRNSKSFPLGHDCRFMSWRRWGVGQQGWLRNVLLEISYRCQPTLLPPTPSNTVVHDPHPQESSGGASTSSSLSTLTSQSRIDILTLTIPKFSLHELKPCRAVNPSFIGIEVTTLPKGGIGRIEVTFHQR